MPKISVTIPGDVNKHLSPNARTHWRTRAGAVKDARKAAMYSAMSTLSRERVNVADILAASGVHYDVTVAWGKRRKIMDDDNIRAALKPFQDGIADAMIVNDKVMECRSVTQVRADGDPEITFDISFDLW